MAWATTLLWCLVFITGQLAIFPCLWRVFLVLNGVSRLYGGIANQKATTAHFLSCDPDKKVVVGGFGSAAHRVAMKLENQITGGGIEALPQGTMPVGATRGSTFGGEAVFKMGDVSNIFLIRYTELEGKEMKIFVEGAMCPLQMHQKLTLWLVRRDTEPLKTMQ